MRCFLKCPYLCDWCQPLHPFASFIDKLSFEKLVSDTEEGGKSGRIFRDVKTANFDFQMTDASRINSTLEEICSPAISDDISDERLEWFEGTRVITKSVFISYNLARSIRTIPVNQELFVSL